MSRNKKIWYGDNSPTAINEDIIPISTITWDSEDITWDNVTVTFDSV